jgi:hypothetical protein
MYFTVSLKMEVTRMYETPLHVYHIMWCYVKGHNFRFVLRSRLLSGITVVICNCIVIINPLIRP